MNLVHFYINNFSYINLCCSYPSLEAGRKKIDYSLYHNANIAV